MKFEAGKTYYGRFICNSDSKITIKVLKRTAKTVLAEDLDGGEVKRLRIKLHDDIEFVHPMGSNYSMAPRVTADRVAL